MQDSMRLPVASFLVAFLLWGEVVADDDETNPLEGLFFGLRLGQLASDIGFERSNLMAEPMYFGGEIPLSERYRLHQKEGLYSVIQQNKSAADGFQRSEINYLPNYGVIEKWFDSTPIEELTSLDGKYIKAIARESLEVGFAGRRSQGVQQKKGDARLHPHQFFVCGIWRERIFLAQDHTGKVVSDDFSFQRSQFFADALKSLGFWGSKEPSTEAGSPEWILSDAKSRVRIQALGRVQHITISPAEGSKLERQCQETQARAILNS